MQIDATINLIPIMIDQELFDQMLKIARKRQSDVATEISIAILRHLEKAVDDSKH